MNKTAEAPKAKILVNKKKEHYYFNVVAKNGDILCSSRTFKDLKECLVFVEVIKSNAAKSEIRKTWWLHQKYHFRFLDDNKKVITKSEKYHNLKDCTASLTLVRNLSLSNTPIEYSF